MRDIPNSNGFETLRAKNKIGKMPTDATSTLSKVDYKSYRDFLESYQDNKTVKDDQESVSSTDSGISLCKLSDGPNNDASATNLNLDSSAKASSPKIEQNAAAFVGRTGSFRNYLENYNNKKFSSVKPTVTTLKPNLIKSEIVIRVNEPKKNNGAAAANKTIGAERTNDAGLVSPSSKEIEAPNYPPPPPLHRENGEAETRRFAPPPPPPPPTKPPGSEFTSGRKWAAVKTEDSCRKSGSPEKLPVNNEAAANLAKVLKQHLLPRRKALEDQETQSKTTQNDDASIDETTQKPSGIIRNFNAISAKQKQSRDAAPKITNNGRSSSPNGNGEFNTTTVVPVADGSLKVNKGDPNVRKLVYNTYRGFLGAYNNKANDMIATLPRTMVREDQGISKQLESIALQGALEKLNGRINPNVEQE